MTRKNFELKKKSYFSLFKTTKKATFKTKKCAILQHNNNDY